MRPSDLLITAYAALFTDAYLPSSTDALFLETSSLTGENVEAPFALAAKSILMAIESGRLDPEKAGSGISYGDRSLRRVGSGSRFSFSEMLPNGAGRNGGGLVQLRQSVKHSFDGCCS